MDEIIQYAADYGCVLPRAGDIVRTQEGVLGQMRGSRFHPVTDEGAAFLRTTNNPLARAL